MKRILRIAVPILMLLTQTLRADNADCLQAAVDEMNANYHTGSGCEDGIFNAVSASMIGWGVGLFIGIALLTGLVHNSHLSTSDSSDSSSSSQ